MAPVAQRKGSTETKERLVAVLLADSFSKHFLPVTIERPKVLLPVVNAPVIDYTLEWLAMNGVEDVYVLCCAHAEQVQEHLKAAGWHRRRNFNVEAIVSTDCMSVGDALRLLDHKDFLKSDFVLVSGDVVTNMNLQDALKEHGERRGKDKSAIMTAVMKGGMYADHRLRLGDLGALTIMDPLTKRLLKFEENQSTTSDGNECPVVKLDTSFFYERNGVVARTDLVDTGIYICAPEVLMLFSDNFDYQNVRKDFITGVLSEEELGNKIFMYEVRDRYAARIRSLRSYSTVNKDVLSRWTYPLVPDSNLFRVTDIFNDTSIGDKWGAPESNYKYSKGRIYVDDCVTVAREAKLQHTLCIGNGTIIGPGAIIRDSIISKNCKIGANAVIIGSFVGNDVRIESDVRISHAMVCDGAIIKERASIQPNCIISYRVVIDKGATVTKNTRVTLVKPDPDAAAVLSGSDNEDEDSAFGTSPAGHSVGGLSEDGEKAVLCVEAAAMSAALALGHGGVPEVSMAFDTNVVGPMGAGYVWPNASQEKDPDLAARKSLAYDIEALTLQETNFESQRILHEESSLVAQGEEGDVESDSGEEANNMEMMEDHHFKQEVAETLLRCIKEHIAHENVIIELNGLKIAEDKTFADCARFILTTSLGLCMPPPDSTLPEYRSLYATEAPESSKEGKLALLKRVAQQLKTWASLLQKFLRSDDDQIEVLLTLEEFCAGEGDFENSGEKGESFTPIFPQLLKLMYELDILSENAILSWAEEKEHASDHEKRFLELAAPFIAWLEEAEEESSSEDESDE